jgi:hypothetical protein
MLPQTDKDAWLAYPEHHHIFNKLWLADILNYTCGPCGVPIPRQGKYIVRPIYNLDGMSLGAKTKFLNYGDESTPPGYFWCEFFEGNHYSVDFCRDTKSKWNPVLVVQGEKINNYKFISWCKVYDKDFVLPKILADEFDTNTLLTTINVEYIGDKIIEIHLRSNPDFNNHSFSELQVIWASDNIMDVKEKYKDYTFIEAIEVSNNDTRLGFYAK